MKLLRWSAKKNREETEMRRIEKVLKRRYEIREKVRKELEIGY